MRTGSVVPSSVTPVLPVVPLHPEGPCPACAEHAAGQDTGRFDRPGRSVGPVAQLAQSAIGRYTRLPAAANSFDFWAMPSSISPWLPPWRRRMSCEIFIEQNFGPHIEQK